MHMPGNAGSRVTQRAARWQELCRNSASQLVVTDHSWTICGTAAESSHIAGLVVDGDGEGCSIKFTP